ncbi:MAG TPA: hypothetical protein VGD62_12910 [Acidobacteriaceae bacterium]
MAALALSLLCGVAHAQQLAVVSDPVPDAPSAVAAQSSTPGAGPTVQTPNGPVNPDTGQPKQTKRILGVIPNFRAVSADQKLPPQTPREKLFSTAQQSFDYSAFILPAVLAADAQGSNSEPQFHQGAAGYGRYYWHAWVDQTDENFWVQAFLPIALRQDSRYYTLGHGGVVKRGAYAFSRIFITRTDGDRQTFNASEIVGSGIASSLSGLYYPSVDRTWTKTGQRWLLNVGIDGGVFMFQEFWPNINNAIFHQKD